VLIKWREIYGESEEMKEHELCVNFVASGNGGKEYQYNKHRMYNAFGICELSMEYKNKKQIVLLGFC